MTALELKIELDKLIKQGCANMEIAVPAFEKEKRVFVGVSNPTFGDTSGWGTYLVTLDTKTILSIKE